MEIAAQNKFRAKIYFISKKIWLQKFSWCKKKIEIFFLHNFLLEEFFFQGNFFWHIKFSGKKTRAQKNLQCKKLAQL